MVDDLVDIAKDSARGGFMLISGTAISTVILAISAILIGRFLGPGSYGQYTLAISIPQLLYLFTDLGINQGVTKFTAAFNTKQEKDRMFKLVRSALLLRALVGVLLFAINYALAEILGQIFLQRPELAFYIRIASFSILFQVIFTTASAAFVGIDKTEYSALATNIQAMAKTIMQISLVLLGLGVAGAVLGHAIGYAASAGASAVIILLLFRNRSAATGNKRAANDFRNLVRYSAPLFASILLTGFAPLFQNFVLASYVTDAQVGNYKVALNFATLVTVLSIPITTALLPAFSKIDSAAMQKLRLFFKHANKYTAMLIVPVTVLLIVYSTQIVSVVYGSTYESAPLFLATNCLLYFLVGIGYLTLASLFNGVGETRTTFVVNAITFLMILALCPIMTATYGVLGLIVAFLTANLAGTLYGLVKAKRKYQIELDVFSLSRIYFVSAVSAIPSVLMLVYAPFTLPANLAVGGTLYLLVYATMTPMTRIITFNELQTVTGIVQRIPVLGTIAKPVLAYQKRILARNA
jgi:O-antigen/teichoic acid export membrane protein